MSEPLCADDVVVIAHNFRFQWEEAQGCHVLLYPEGMVKLNPAAGEILKRCDGSRTIDQVVAVARRQQKSFRVIQPLQRWSPMETLRGWGETP